MKLFPARKHTESMEAYRKRRKSENDLVRNHLSGRYLVQHRVIPIPTDKGNVTTYTIQGITYKR